MRISFFDKLRSWPVARRDDVVLRDAEALLREWGDSAYDRATYLSWEEDFGIVASAKPGHWWRVRREVARLIDRREADPRAEFGGSVTSETTGAMPLPGLGALNPLRLDMTSASRSAK